MYSLTLAAKAEEEAWVGLLKHMSAAGPLANKKITLQNRVSNMSPKLQKGLRREAQVVNASYLPVVCAQLGQVLEQSSGLLGITPNVSAGSSIIQSLNSMEVPPLGRASLHQRIKHLVGRQTQKVLASSAGLEMVI